MSSLHFLIIPFLLLLPLAGQVTAAKPPRPSVARGATERPYIRNLRVRARRGEAKAQFDLGVCYHFGQGVPQDDAEAVAWYRKAAERRYAKAQYNLGVCCDLGRGLPQDHAEAVGWYGKAARQGHAKAQFNLGISYKIGQGTSQDLVEAYAWLSLAAAGGEAPAFPARDELGKRLSPAELEQAQARERKLVEELRPRKRSSRMGGKRAAGTRRGRP